jgi:hypothetical protein
MRRWVWAALGISRLASACDRPDAPSQGQDPAATASATPSASATPAASATPTVTTTATAIAAPAPPSDGGPSPSEAPLLYWMRDHAAKALREGDAFALAAAFDQIASFSPKVPPPAYANWVSIANDGAAAARAASPEGAKAACRGCHAQYRKTYQTEMRSRPLP